MAIMPAYAHAQLAATVSAQIYDVATAQPLDSASVLVLQSDDRTAISGGVTDAQGRIAIANLEAGNYIFLFSAAGYETQETPVLISERNDIYNLGRIDLILQSSGEEYIDEVVTTAQRIARDTEIGIGVNSFSIANNAIASTGSTLNALKGLPGIAVEREGTVLLRGSDRVVILVNGQQSALTGIGNQTGLDSLPAANIERIEIINNPSARFGAAGSAGLINIIMKEDKTYGLSGDVGWKLGLGVLERAREDLPTELGSFARNPKAVPSFNLNYGGDKTDFFLQGEILFQDNLPNNEFTTRFYDDGRIIESQVPENRMQTHYILKGGADHRLNDSDTLSISGVFDYETHEDNAEVPFIDQATGEPVRFWFWTETEVTGHASVDVKYAHEFNTEGHKIEARAEYIRGWEDEEYDLNEISDLRVGGAGFDNFHLVATENTVPISLDYTRPLASGRLELGTKAQFRWIPITYDSTAESNPDTIIFEGLGDFSEWNENIFAAYGNYVYETDRYAIEAGLRAEQTDVKYEISEENIFYDTSDEYDYFRLFPNLRGTYKISEATDFSAFYNNRVDRPGEPELRLFPKLDDPELLKVGNPFLRPQFTESFEVALQHRFENATLGATAYWRNIEDHFQRIYVTSPQNNGFSVINKIYQNTGDARNIGGELVGTYKPTSGISLSGSFNIYEIDQEAALVTFLFPEELDFLIPESNDITWNAKLTGEFALPADVKLQVTGIYYDTRDIPQGREFARSSVDLGLSKSVLNDKVDLYLSATDIFNDFSLEQELRGDDFTADYQNFYETQTVFVGATYNF